MGPEVPVLDDATAIAPPIEGEETVSPEPSLDPAPEPTPEPLADEERAELARLREVAKAHEDAQVNQLLEKTIADDVDTFRRQMRAAGHDEIAIEEMIPTVQAIASKSVNQMVANLQQQQYIAEKNQAMQKLHAESGVPIELLEQFDKYKPMKAFSDQYKMINELKNRVGSVEQSRVPSQEYVDGPGGSGNVPYVERLKNGEALPSAAEIDRITAQYLR